MAGEAAAEAERENASAGEAGTEGADLAAAEAATAGRAESAESGLGGSRPECARGACGSRLPAGSAGAACAATIDPFPTRGAGRLDGIDLGTCSPPATATVAVRLDPDAGSAEGRLTDGIGDGNLVASGFRMPAHRAQHVHMRGEEMHRDEPHGSWMAAASASAPLCCSLSVSSLTRHLCAHGCSRNGGGRSVEGKRREVGGWVDRRVGWTDGQGSSRQREERREPLDHCARPHTHATQNRSHLDNYAEKNDHLVIRMMNHDAWTSRFAGRYFFLTAMLCAARPLFPSGVAHLVPPPSLPPPSLPSFCCILA